MTLILALKSDYPEFEPWRLVPFSMRIACSRCKGLPPLHISGFQIYIYYIYRNDTDVVICVPICMVWVLI